MVDLILSEAQLDCLKAAVTIGSEESAALGRGRRLVANCSVPSRSPSSARVGSRRDC
jgi:hypothetical protein